MKTDRIKILLAISIVLTVMSGIITYYAIRESRARLGALLHSYKVLNQGNEAFAALRDLEGNQRRYLLTGDTTLLRSLKENESRLPRVIDSLKNLVTDNEAQSAFLSRTILPLINKAKAGITEDRAALDLLSPDKIPEFTHTGNTHLVLDSLRTALRQFNKIEVDLLTGRLASMQDTLDQQNLSRYISFLLISIVSILAFIALGRKQNQNDALISKLEETNETLEEKVKDRTRELELQNVNVLELNEQLRQTMEEMESFNEALHLHSVKTEDKLKEIRDLYDNAPCGYHSLSSDGTIIHINDRELEWLGYTREEVVGKMKIIEVLKQEDHQSYKEDFVTLKKEGSILNVERTLIRKDGTLLPVILNATSLYDEHGNFLMSRSSIFDITDKKIAEQKLIQANKDLKNLNEEKNHFLGIVAHDLRNPLQGIIGLINLIERKSSNLTTEQQDYLKYIYRSCLNMQTLITNLLDINKIEQGISANISSQSVELNTITTDMMTLFGESARLKNISLKIECNAPEKKIQTDLALLTRILENLVSNAIKFSPKDKVVHVRIIHNHSEVTFEVIDQGQGISKEEMPRLFKKFQKLQARPTDKESSTGLGLSIVKELVHSLNGTITVESEVNIGSKFRVEFPADNLSPNLPS